VSGLVSGDVMELFPGIFQTVLFLLMIFVWMARDFRMRSNDLYSREDCRTDVSCCNSLKENVVDLFKQWSGKEILWAAYRAMKGQMVRI